MTKKKFWDRTEDPNWEAIDSFIAEHFLEADPALEAALAASDAAGLPPIQVDPLQGKLLTMLAAALGDPTVVELADTGHSMMVEHPRGVKRAILDALDTKRPHIFSTTTTTTTTPKRVADLRFASDRGS